MKLDSKQKTNIATIAVFSLCAALVIIGSIMSLKNPPEPPAENQEVPATGATPTDEQTEATDPAE